MDLEVGRLLDRLEQRGLRENTLVVFMSDNGFSLGHHGFWGKGNGTNPFNMYERSIRVPALLSHPGRIPASVVQAGMVSAYDFLPTLLAYLELPVPEGRDLPGTNLLPAWLGQPMADRDHVVVFDEYGATRMIRTNAWKYVHRYPDGPHELFDLVNDPEERVNLSSDIGQANRVRALHREMDDWFARFTQKDRDGRHRTVSGSGQLRRIGTNFDMDLPAFARHGD